MLKASIEASFHQLWEKAPDAAPRVQQYLAEVCIAENSWQYLKVALRDAEDHRNKAGGGARGLAATRVKCPASAPEVQAIIKTVFKLFFAVQVP